MVYPALNNQIPRSVVIGNSTRGPYTLQDVSGTSIRVRLGSQLELRRYSSTTDETGTALVLNTDYTINNTNIDSVTVTLTSAQEVLTSSQRLVIGRRQTIADVISLAQGANFSGPSLADAISVLTERQQELRKDVDRSVKVAWLETDAPSLPLKPTTTTQPLGHTTDGKIVHYDAPALAAVSAGYLVGDESTATGDGATTAFVIAGIGAGAPNHLDILIDGIGPQPWSSYNVELSGTTSTVTFTDPPPNGSYIQFRPRVFPGIEGPRGEQDRTSLSEYATDATPLVGDGTTTNNVAIAAAEASSVKQLGVPEGTYRTTGVATGAALTKTYFGPGQIETTDGNALPPNWRVVSALPTEGNHDYILTAGNGDAQKMQDFLGTWVTGSSTLTQPASGYKIVYEAAGRLNHFLLTASAGWNQSTTGNGGRTGYFHTVTKGTQAGNGDAGGYYTSIFVSGARTAGVGGPGTPTDALAMPGGVVHGGQVVAGANDVYLNNIEMNAVDAGYRASAGVFVANLNRTNSDTTNNQFWFAFTAQSIGTQDADTAYRVSGAWKHGVDLTPATLSANQAAIVLKQNQRIYLEGTAGSRFPSAVGTTYISANSSGIDLNHGGNAALRVTSLTTPVNYIEVQGTTSGTPVQVVTRGTDTNVGFDIRPKGTGTIRLRGGTGGVAQVQVNDTGVGFFTGTPIAKPTVTGSRGANAALQSLLTALANLGLITDSSS